MKAYTKGFTLVELLVVISIIAILLGILLPNYFRVKENARVVMAVAGTKGLETAFKSYLDMYRVWPTAWADGPINDNIFKALRGDKDPTFNPQGIAFYEFASYTAYPLMDQTTAWDSWSNPSTNISWRAYRVMFDKNYDNKIDALPSVYRSVVVYSEGENRQDEQGDGDDIASWK